MVAVRPRKIRLHQKHRTAPQADCPVCSSSNVELFCTAYDRVLQMTSERWQILRCTACGFGWTFPPLPVERIPSYYPPTYLGDIEKSLEEYLSGNLQGSRSWRGEIEKTRLVERFVSGGRILDVGCGGGQFLWALDPDRWERIGVELSEAAVMLVRRRLSSVQLFTGDIYTNELPEGAFDAVTFWHVLEHLPDPEVVLRRAYALLRARGWLIVSLPNIASIQARLFRNCWYAFDDVPRHLHHFSERSLDLLIERAGFQLRRHLQFSPLVNFHALKHSLIYWSEEHFRTRIPYYALKPLLFLFPLLERIARSYGMLTVVAQKQEAPG